MSNKHCPFCKNIVSPSDVTCPHCKRVLFERISHGTSHNTTQHQTHHTTNTAKKSEWKNKAGTFFSKLVFWKTSQQYKKSGNMYYAHNDKVGKFKKIFVAIAVLVFVFGFYLRNNNLSIAVPTAVSDNTSNNTVASNKGFFKEDKSRYYLQTFKSVGDDLGANVKSVAKLTGTSRDSQGRMVNHYLYENSNLNITLFKAKWDIINTEYANLETDILAGKLPDQAKLNEVLNYYKSVYFFAANELWFRAYDNGDRSQVQKITNEITSAIDDDQFNTYLKNSGELPSANLLISKIGDVSQNLSTEAEIDRLKKQIDDCEYYENCGNYNYLIDRYNNLIPEYNAGVGATKDLFSKFINLIDVYLIFPGQDTLEQTGTQDN